MDNPSHTQRTLLSLNTPLQWRPSLVISCSCYWRASPILVPFFCLPGWPFRYNLDLHRFTFRDSLRGFVRESSIKNIRSFPCAPAGTLCLQALVEHSGRAFQLQFDEFQMVSSSHDDTVLIGDFLNDPAAQVEHPLLPFSNVHLYLEISSHILTSDLPRTH